MGDSEGVREQAGWRESASLEFPSFINLNSSFPQLPVVGCIE